MNMIDIIFKKRDGGELSEEEIRFFVKEYTEGTIPDYQAAALLMAIYFNPLSDDEIFCLTDAMRVSGDIMNLSEIHGIKVDKHSTGGVGDKITLTAAPIAAAAGVPVAKLSGRGLGFTGGTIDKLEAVPGFRTALSEEEFKAQVNDINLALTSQTADVAPADKKIYALRDVTGTVDILSLIASSIMSKKLASGSDAIVLDVKCGKGAFMKSREEAKKLAQIMCRIGNSGGKKTVALITDMNEPLGFAVGNSLEVIEAIETLKNNGPADIEEITIAIAGAMIFAGEKVESFEAGKLMAEEILKSGKALEKFREFIEKQGGNPQITEDYSMFKKASKVLEIKAEKSGYVASIDAEKTGYASEKAGAGRMKKEDAIDSSAGIVFVKKTGDKVSRGDVLARIYTNREKVDDAVAELEKAFSIETNFIEKKSKILEFAGFRV